MNRLAVRSLSGSFRILSTLVLVAFASFFANAQTGHSGKLAEQSAVLTYTESVLHTFTASPDGRNPASSLVADSSGNLYGTTYEGGTYCVDYDGCGTVFELSPDGNGGWTYNIIYSFPGGISGAYPTSLVMDGQGNLYGTAAESVFELCPQPNGGPWVVCNAYQFLSNGVTSTFPNGPPVVDSAGNVYVTLLNYGAYGYGTVAELVLEPGGNGQAPFWSQQTLYDFTGGSDGAYPEGGLIMDKGGNLYGTTSSGGGTGYLGVAFKLHPTAKGTWKESVLYAFGANTDGTVGYAPAGSLIFDKAGNLYGTTHTSFQNGSYGPGAVYKLTRSGQITSLYLFTQGDTGAGVVFDKDGNLYGAAFSSGNCPGEGCGIVYELTPPADGQTTTWTETALYNFTGGSDGAETPYAYTLPPTPLFDNAGNLYGTTFGGGENYGNAGFGVVYKLVPNPVATTTTITRNAPNPSKTGQLVTVSFTVTQTVKANSQPTGTVTVNANTGESCIAALPPNGNASCQLLFATAGTRTLTATYSGDAADLGSVSTAVTQSTFNSTSTIITKHAPDPAKVGRVVTVEFSVDAKDATKQTKPTGGVTVNASTGESCTGTLSAGGKGKCQLTFGSSGITTLTATYAGDADNEGSVSRAVEQAVE